MKMFVYSIRDYDEKEFFDKYAEEFGIEYDSTDELPSMENAYLAEGCDAINIITTPINAELVDRFYDLGVRCIATRTIGYDHIDYVYAKSKGMGVVNISYSPYTVADYTVMMMLMGLRKIKHIAQRAVVQDFTLKGKIGKELRACTVGIVGTGRIGEQVIKELSGFGCRIIAYSPHPKDHLREMVEYVDIDTLYKESDIISLHAVGINENRHMIGSRQFDMMKDGVGIVNCARGLLIDSDAMIANLESGKIGFACLDTIEDEFGLYYYDRVGEPLENRSMAILKAFTNVIVTPHMAFYTDEVVSNMIENSIQGILDYFSELQ